MNIGRVVALLIGIAVACFIAFVVLAFMGIIPSAKPKAGTQAVLTYRPIIYGTEGVDPTPVMTGRTFVSPTTLVDYVDMRPQQYTVHFDDFMSKDGVPLDFDAVIRLQVTDSVKLIRDFGTKWYESNVEAELANRVRQAVRKHGMNEVAIDTAAVDDIDNEVSQAMREYLSSAGLPVQLIQITVGKANPPDAIKNQRIETATQQQAVLTQQQRKLAEDERKAAEASRAAADQEYRNAMTLTTDQFVQLEWLKSFREVCGAGHCTVVTAGAATPVLSVNK